MSSSEAWDKIVDLVTPLNKGEIVASVKANHRILASNITAHEPLPSFDRSTVDGYAIKSSDSYGASDSLPVYLELAGEVKMGAIAEIPVETGKCVLVHTGGMIPEGADAVIMLEYTSSIDSGTIELHKPVALFENVIKMKPPLCFNKSNVDQIITKMNDITKSY